MSLLEKLFQECLDRTSTGTLRQWNTLNCAFLACLKGRINPFPRMTWVRRTRSTAPSRFILTWKGEKTGEGKMTITELRAPENILLKLEFYSRWRALRLLAG